MSFQEFINQYFVWVLVILIILIITVIGFIADKKSKKKKEGMKEMNEQNAQEQMGMNNNMMPNPTMGQSMDNANVSTQQMNQPVNNQEMVLPNIPVTESVSTPEPVVNNDMNFTPISEQTPSIAPTFEGMPVPPAAQPEQQMNMQQPAVNAQPIIEPVQPVTPQMNPQVEQPAVQPIIEPVAPVQPMPEPIAPVMPTETVEPVVSAGAQPINPMNIEMPSAPTMQQPQNISPEPFQPMPEPIIENPQVASTVNQPINNQGNMNVTSENNNSQSPTTPW